jgi:hypothetical protein
MALQSSSSGTFKLVGVLLTPSWTSGLFTVLISILIVGGTLLLSHIGSATQQTLLGLHAVYRSSTVGIDTNSVGQHLSSNSVFNNAVLFVLWGSVGLAVYTIVQGMANEFRNTSERLHELNFVHSNQPTIIRDIVLRGVIRLAALASWWILAWLMFHRVIPYTIAAAHLTAYKLGDVSSWLYTLLGFILCVLCIHCLVVLIRLIFLKPRLSGNSIIDSSENQKYN